MSKTQQLQDYLDENLKDYHDEWFIEYHGRGGWWAVPCHPRHFGDKGIYLGQNAGIAKRTIGLAF
jgi:hypothetical protein